MPTNKDLKRLVRRRMQKTGESYTTARAQLLKARPSAYRRRNGAPVAAATRAARARKSPLPSNYAKLAGMSDAAVKAATGCNWERWVKALDHVEAHTWPHRTIAKYVREKYKTPAWWTQMITVGYEKIRGLRVVGQRRNGTYETSRSRTFPVPIERLFAAFAEAKQRARWLKGATYTVRRTRLNRAVLITWEDGTSIEAGFLVKGEAKSSVQVAHTKLPNRDAIATSKAYWGERLDALQELLTP